MRSWVSCPRYEKKKQKGMEAVTMDKVSQKNFPSTLMLAGSTTAEDKGQGTVKESPGCHHKKAEVVF